MGRNILTEGFLSELLFFYLWSRLLQANKAHERHGEFESGQFQWIHRRDLFWGCSFDCTAALYATVQIFRRHAPGSLRENVGCILTEAEALLLQSVADPSAPTPYGEILTHEFWKLYCAACRGILDPDWADNLDALHKPDILTSADPHWEQDVESTTSSARIDYLSHRPNAIETGITFHLPMISEGDEVNENTVEIVVSKGSPPASIMDVSTAARGANLSELPWNDMNLENRLSDGSIASFRKPV